MLIVATEIVVTSLEDNASVLEALYNEYEITFSFNGDLVAYKALFGEREYSYFTTLALCKGCDGYVLFEKEDINPI